jgi:diadenosine tetraphosphate (Ap4A) HIT family hydrolase
VTDGIIKGVLKGVIKGVIEGSDESAIKGDIDGGIDSSIKGASDTPVDCDLCTLLATPAATTGVLWRDDRVVVLLIDDAAYPGFCRVVWQDHVKEMTDLPDNERNYMMAIVWQVELALRDVLHPEKINLASFGNMTPHVHWHVIPRFADDGHFPDPTWAAVRRATAPEVLAARAALLPQLGAAIAARLSGLTTQA